MINHILDKTDKGREEIATRKYQLAPRLRTLLLLADGKQRTETLLAKVIGLGLSEENIKELIANGFIQVIADPSVVDAAPASSAPAVEAAPPEAANQAPASQGILAEGETQFSALYHFYTETIKSTIGLRGYGLQLKVERASNIDDFRDLRRPYLEAVLKAKGKEMARSLRDRLDQLLYLGEAPPLSTIITPSTVIAPDTETPE